MIPELVALSAVAAAAWLWFDTLRARESAIDAARRACESEGVQLLDDTVALERSRLKRDADGRIAILRVYRFEWSDTGDNRLRGSVTVLGRALQTLHLEARTAPRTNLLA
jgi:hypothetical protein